MRPFRVYFLPELSCISNFNAFNGAKDLTMVHKFFVVCALSLGIVWSYTSHAMQAVENSCQAFDPCNDEHEEDVLVTSLKKSPTSTHLQSVLVNIETSEQFLMLEKHLEEYHVDTLDDTGSTLLHHAVSLGKLNIVKELVWNYKANKDIINNFKQTPLGSASFWFSLTNKSCFNEIIKLLNPSIQFYNN